MANSSDPRVSLSRDTKELLVVAALFAGASVLLAIFDRANTAGAMALGSAVWLFVAYHAHREDSIARQKMSFTPAELGEAVPPIDHDAIVANLARIDQRIEQMKATIATHEDDGAVRSAEVEIADLQNERYNLEAQLRVGE